MKNCEKCNNKGLMTIKICANFPEHHNTNFKPKWEEKTIKCELCDLFYINQHK